MRSSVLALGLGVMTVLPAGLPVRAADDSRTVGRVRVTTIRKGAAVSESNIAATLAVRFAPAPGRRFADQRVISLRPRSGVDQRFEVTIYDYATERAFDLVLDRDGSEVSRQLFAGQPARSLDELADAGTIVRESAPFAAGLAQGDLEIYEAMPAISTDALGRRLVNVGVMSHPTAGGPLGRNEIVSVHIPTGEIVRYDAGAPGSSRAALVSCGPSTSGCSYATGPCSYYQIVWPSDAPIWQLNVRHPKCTQSVQNDATGLEITDVYYKGRLILKRGEVPVLNVLYQNNTCGPYRDWMYSEDCFQAVGTDVPSAGSGIRVTTAPGSTLCESGSDAGNFRGVAIYDQGDALWLMTETNAGWYRYVMEWRLHKDGTIEPIFGFGATSNSCTCNLHFHHAYWRLEWAIDATADGTTDDPATGIDTLERLRAGTQDVYDPISTEGSFVRPSTAWEKDFWRIKNPVTGNGYVIEPNILDGNAVGDTYGKWDLTALALNSNEINDPNSNTSINVAPWVNGEALGGAKRLVTWYHASFTHNDPTGTGEACELVGPRLVPLIPCAGSLALDKQAYTCSAAVAVSLNDSDLAGQGTATVTVVSNTESVAEDLVLAESPPGSGQFRGTINAAAAPAVNGDGKISVADGDTIHARYLDASACGTPNVPVEKTAGVDCVAPKISNVRSSVAGSSATIRWDTSESASSVVHYATVLPTTSTASVAGFLTAHEVPLMGLAQCTTYYFWVESADAAGNVSASNHGGGYFAFTTGQDQQRSYSSTDTPVAIPDNSTTGATSTIAVTDSGVVQDVNATVKITHTFDADLSLVLITPTNTSIGLATRLGGSGDNYANTTFDDEAATPISAGSPPFTGTFRPESLLAAADGISAAGNWRFKVVDQAGQDVGTIDTWTLTLTLPATSCPAGAPPPPVPEGPALGGLTATRVDATGTTMHLAWDKGLCPSKNYHLLFGQLATVATYALDGGVCGLGPNGGYDWDQAPAGSLWFVVVSDDAAATEGTWGKTANNADRNGSTASGLCGFTTRSNAGTCP